MDFILKLLALTLSLGCDARVIAPARKARLTVAESAPSYFYRNIDGYPGTYAFGYDVRDPATGNVQFRSEERYPNGTVIGSYGYVDANGRPHTYKYIADERGYRVMNELPTKHPVIQPHQMPQDMESSITWSRPKKKKNTAFLTKLPIKKEDNVSKNNILLPPSYYASVH